MLSRTVGGQINAGEVFLRVHTEPVAKGAVPAPFTHRAVDAGKFRIRHYAHAQPVAIAPLGSPVVSLALLGSQMIRKRQSLYILNITVYSAAQIRKSGPVIL